MLVGTAVSGAGSLMSSWLGANAAQQAAAAQLAGTKEGIKLTKQMFGTVKGELQPYVNTGKFGMTGVKNLLGGGNMDPALIQKTLEGLPGYQFALKQGLQAAQSGFAAKGLGQSGAAIKGAADYATGLASETYGKLFDQFLSTAQLGEGAAAALGGVSSNFNSSINNLITGGAQATASGIVGTTNAITGGIGNFTDAVSQGAMMLGLNNAGYFGNAGGGRNALVPSNWSGGGGGGGGGSGF